MKELFNDGKIRVRTNDSGEIFIEALQAKVKKCEIRVRTVGASLNITADSCTFNPTSFNGLGGFIIR